MQMLQSAAIYADLFAGTTTYTRTGLSSIAEGRGIIVAVQMEGTRSCTGVTLGSSGTTTALTLKDSIANQCYIFQGTATGNETNTDVVVTASGNTSGGVGYAVFVVDEWAEDQSAADVEKLSTSGTNFDTPAVTPPTAINVVIVAADRANRTWTEDSDYTMLTTGDARWAAGYLLQTAATPQGHTMVADTSGAGNVVLIAFAGEAGTPPASNTAKIVIRKA